MPVRSAVIAVLSLMAACTVGEVPIGGGDGGGSGGGGGMSFNAMIKPLVTECVACHGTLQPPNLMDFQSLQAKYKMKPGNANVFVTKGSLTAGIHQGIPYLTTDEQTTVAAWIDSLQ